MIVTIGKVVKVDHGRFLFYSDCKTPGRVTVSDHNGQVIDLPGSKKKDAEAFIKAYLRVVNEPIDYVSGEFE